MKQTVPTVAETNAVRGLLLHHTTGSPAPPASTGKTHWRAQVVTHVRDVARATAQCAIASAGNQPPTSNIRLRHTAAPDIGGMAVADRGQLPQWPGYGITLYPPAYTKSPAGSNSRAHATTVLLRMPKASKPGTVHTWYTRSCLCRCILLPASRELLPLPITRLPSSCALAKTPSPHLQHMHAVPPAPSSRNPFRTCPHATHMPPATHSIHCTNTCVHAQLPTTPPTKNFFRPPSPCNTTSGLFTAPQSPPQHATFSPLFPASSSSSSSCSCSCFSSSSSSLCRLGDVLPGPHERRHHRPQLQPLAGAVGQAVLHVRQNLHQPHLDGGGQRHAHHEAAGREGRGW